MYPSKNNSPNIILWGIGCFLLIMGILLLIFPPALSADPSQGFLVWHSMQLGGGFNNLVSPDQTNISKNSTEFLTWWSPGQYAVPALLRWVTGLNMGRAIALTVSICGYSGLAGIYFFFSKVGFGRMVTAISLLFIVAQMAFMFPYVYYTGGEILIFAFEGWFLYGCVSFKQTGTKLVLFVLLSALAGFFLKSTFLWMYAAGLLCLWLRLSADGKNISTWLKNALWIGLPAAISLAAIYLLYILKGESPITKGKGLKLSWEAFGFPLASPVLSGFSIDDLANGLINRVEKAVFTPGWSIVILALCVVASIMLIWAIIRYVPFRDYKLFLITFYATAVLFFGQSYLRQLDISMDARHFRMIGILVVPGLVFLVLKAKPVYKVLFATLFIGLSIGSISFLWKRFPRVNIASARGITQIAQPNIDQTALNALLKIDQTQRHLTFVFIGSDIGLELINNRFIPLLPIPDDSRTDPDDYDCNGFAGPICIVMPKWYHGDKEKLLLNSFPGYKNFRFSTLSPGYVGYFSDTKNAN